MVGGNGILFLAILTEIYTLLILFVLLYADDTIILAENEEKNTIGIGQSTSILYNV